MVTITTAIYRLLMVTAVVILLDMRRVAVIIAWHDIRKLDEAEEQETNDNE